MYVLWNLKSPNNSHKWLKMRSLATILLNRRDVKRIKIKGSCEISLLTMFKIWLKNGKNSWFLFDRASIRGRRLHEYEWTKSEDGPDSAASSSRLSRATGSRGNIYARISATAGRSRTNHFYFVAHVSSPQLRRVRAT